MKEHPSDALALWQVIAAASQACLANGVLWVHGFTAPVPPKWDTHPVEPPKNKWQPIFCVGSTHGEVALPWGAPVRHQTKANTCFRF